MTGITILAIAIWVAYGVVRDLMEKKGGDVMD